MVARFWREIPVRYNLIGTKCKKCSTIHFPPRKICTKCNSLEIEFFQLKGSGKIVSYTTIRVPPAGFEKQTPLVIAIVELDEGPRITAQIVDCCLEEVQIGQKVASCFRRISEDGDTGAIYYGYKFKLVK